MWGRKIASKLTGLIFLPGIFLLFNGFVSSGLRIIEVSLDYG
jgi:hypothetical protein